MIDRERGKGLVFIGGCPRSGTTLVQLMLDSHPLVCGGPEFDFIPEIVKLRGNLRKSVDSGRINAYCSVEDVDAEIGALIERLLMPYAHGRGCELISEKTPWDVLVFRELLEIFPKAKFVFCVRDPRAVVASMFQVGDRAKEKGLRGPRFVRSLYSAVDTIKETNAAGFEVASRSDRVLTVAYELVLKDPKRQTMKICSFLGLPWSKEMIRPGEKEHDWEKIMADDVWYTRDMFRSNLDPGRVRKWESQLTVSQQAVIMAAFEHDENLRAIGYDLSDRSLSTLFRALIRVSLRARSNLKSSFLRFAFKKPFIRRLSMRILALLRMAELHNRKRVHDDERSS